MITNNFIFLVLTFSSIILELELVISMDTQAKMNTFYQSQAIALIKAHDTNKQFDASKTIIGVQDALSLLSTHEPFSKDQMRELTFLWPPETYVNPKWREITRSYHFILHEHTKSIARKVFSVLHKSKNVDCYRILLPGLVNVMSDMTLHLKLAARYTAPYQDIGRLSELHVRFLDIEEEHRRLNVALLHRILDFRIMTFQCPTLKDTISLITNPQRILNLESIEKLPLPNKFKIPLNKSMPHDFLKLASDYHYFVGFILSLHIKNIINSKFINTEAGQTALKSTTNLLKLHTQSNREAQSAMNSQEELVALTTLSSQCASNYPHQNVFADGHVQRLGSGGIHVGNMGEPNCGNCNAKEFNRQLRGIW